MVWYLYILQNYHHSYSSVNLLVWSIITHCFKFSNFSCGEYFKIYSLSNFQVYNTLLLTIVTTLCVISSWLICNRKSVSTSPILAPPPKPWLWKPPNCCVFIFCSLWLLVFDSSLKWAHIAFVFIWLISHSIMPSSFIRAITESKISSW